MIRINPKELPVLNSTKFTKENSLRFNPEFSEIFFKIQPKGEIEPDFLQIVGNEGERILGYTHNAPFYSVGTNGKTAILYQASEESDPIWMHVWDWRDKNALKEREKEPEFFELREKLFDANSTSSERDKCYLTLTERVKYSGTGHSNDGDIAESIINEAILRWRIMGKTIYRRKNGGEYDVDGLFDLVVVNEILKELGDHNSVYHNGDFSISVVDKYDNDLKCQINAVIIYSETKSKVAKTAIGYGYYKEEDRNIFSATSQNKFFGVTNHFSLVDDEITFDEICYRIEELLKEFYPESDQNDFNAILKNLRLLD